VLIESVEQTTISSAMSKTLSDRNIINHSFLYSGESHSNKIGLIKSDDGPFGDANIRQVFTEHFKSLYQPKTPKC